MRVILLIFLSAVMAFSVQAAGVDDLLMPKELVTIATEKGCGQVLDFYDRDGPIDPIFVYGYLPGNKGDSAVFWCKKAGEDDRPYRLVIMAKDLTHKNQCSDHIDWWNPPKGLSITQNSTLSLKEFRYIDSPQQAGPSSGHTQGNVIVSSYDGVSEYFYCYNGRWLFSVKH